MYYDIYEIFVNYIYGSGIELTTYQELVATLLSTILCVVCVCIPFYVVICIAIGVARFFGGR